MRNDQQRFRELLEGFETAMLVTHAHVLGAQGPQAIGGARHGYDDLHVRPMAIAHVGEACDVWFLTSRSSTKVTEIELDRHAQIVCQSSRAFLTIAGEARVITDRSKIEEYWEEGYRAWFPNGKNDPDLALLVVDPVVGEYWDQHGTSRFKYLVSAAKAIVTGSRPNVDRDQHAKARLTIPR